MNVFGQGCLFSDYFSVSRRRQGISMETEQSKTTLPINHSWKENQKRIVNYIWCRIIYFLKEKEVSKGLVEGRSKRNVCGEVCVCVLLGMYVCV